VEAADWSWTGVRVYVACGLTDMRKRHRRSGALTQDVLRQKPAARSLSPSAAARVTGSSFYIDGQGFLPLHIKVMERGRFPWPRDEGAVGLTSAQLAIWLWEGN